MRRDRNGKVRNKDIYVWRYTISQGDYYMGNDFYSFHETEEDAMYYYRLSILHGSDASLPTKMKLKDAVNTMSAKDYIEFAGL
jgi:hypothetical protein